MPVFELFFQTWKCEDCGFTDWECEFDWDIETNWTCPECGSTNIDFDPESEK